MNVRAAIEGNQGIETFASWQLPRPQVFRSGNLHHSDNLYRALTGHPMVKVVL